MTRANFAVLVLAAFAVLTLSPSPASAQSTISGVVRDSSGAVMPGVKVEAASEVLIERSRTVTTGTDGRYATACAPACYPQGAGFGQGTWAPIRILP